MNSALWAGRMLGKSSFVNHVFENRALARVSGMPGKTILANVYKVSDGTTWVDLPGYGYARASKGRTGPGGEG